MEVTHCFEKKLGRGFDASSSLAQLCQRRRPATPAGPVGDMSPKYTLTHTGRQWLSTGSRSIPATTSQRDAIGAAISRWRSTTQITKRCFPFSLLRNRPIARSPFGCKDAAGPTTITHASFPCECVDVGSSEMRPPSPLWNLDKMVCRIGVSTCIFGGRPPREHPRRKLPSSDPTAERKIC